ncbi:hypothetical protein BOTBODRAFT_177235 [Botryobasidium botryosum FD-172 SS1]|uniref:Uncharacterized protein n=1 Tax=Botryobasidium botryosum (strain FD-172 SS1) TaxID=930990 RepID=A0A067M7S7_BOTB1|nr:hypothetical protein BOTBODRAFT_177235 [Botryobasidium botryosum FD-172 SS1]
MALSSSSHLSSALGPRISHTRPAIPQTAASYTSRPPSYLLALLPDALAGSSLRNADGDASGKGAGTSKGQVSLERGGSSSRKLVGTAQYGIPRQRANSYAFPKDLPVLPGVRPGSSVAPMLIPEGYLDFDRMYEYDPNHMRAS